jgi:hypothetical protein
MASKKTPVVEYLFEKLSADGRTVALFDDVANAIRFFKEYKGFDLSDNNPANFMKDLLRGMNASANWPESLAQKRITGKQQTGEGRIFEFVPFKDDQTEPFPNPFEPAGDEEEFVIQSLSLPLATKSLGRNDESWLIQVSVWLRILETHFARSTAYRLAEIAHLQNGIKLNRSEIDALFLGVEEDADDIRRNVLITCEAKQQKDPILGDQIVRQISSAFGCVSDAHMDIHYVIPTAIKALKDTGSIYLVEFEPWSDEEANIPEANRKELVVARSAIYRLAPPVPGIGFRPSRRKKSVKPKL